MDWKMLVMLIIALVLVVVLMLIFPKTAEAATAIWKSLGGYA